MMYCRRRPEAARVLIGPSFTVSRNEMMASVSDQTR